MRNLPLCLFPRTPHNACMYNEKGKNINFLTLKQKKAAAKGRKKKEEEEDEEEVEELDTKPKKVVAPDICII